jgi:hypothetical protein
LIPWKESHQAGRLLYLVLDSYRVHMMGSIVEQIQSLDIKVLHIPHIGVSRPIKQEMADQWEEWMMAQGVGDGRDVVTPSRELVSSWIVGMYSRLANETAKLAHACMKKRFEYGMF